MSADGSEEIQANEFDFHTVYLPHHIGNAAFAEARRLLVDEPCDSYAQFEQAWISIQRAKGVRKPPKPPLGMRAVLEDDWIASFVEFCLPLFRSVVDSIAELFPASTLPALCQNVERSMSLSRMQVLCLMICGFLDCFPVSEGVSGGFTLRDIVHYAAGGCNVAKLKGIIVYFRRIAQAGGASALRGSLHITRQCLHEAVDWTACSTTSFASCVAQAQAQGTIEDDGGGMLQADFANMFIGGGVLQHGAVQEEIRFGVTNPELLVSILFCPAMCDNETILLQGAERFSDYAGYNRTLTWKGEHVDLTPRGDDGTFATTIVAMDAIPSATYRQWLPDFIRRELNKAYCAFRDTTGVRIPIATGSWGCGAFGGDKHLKTVIQLCAATLARRPVHFFTFGDAALADDTAALVRQLAASNLSIADVVARLLASAPHVVALHPAERGRALVRALCT